MTPHPFYLNTIVRHIAEISPAPRELPGWGGVVFAAAVIFGLGVVLGMASL